MIFPFGKSENRSDFRRRVREAAPYGVFVFGTINYNLNYSVVSEVTRTSSMVLPMV